MQREIVNIFNVSNNFIKEIDTKIKEIKKYVEIENNKKNPFDITYNIMNKELYGKMSWADITEAEEKKINVINDISKIIKNNNKAYSYKTILNKDIQNIYGNKINFLFKIPIINKIEEMQPSMYWYNGDKNNPMGIYTCLTNNFFIQVPFPDVKTENNIKNIRCIYKYKNECVNLHNNKFCKFIHNGEKINKIASQTRCPRLPRFGNHRTLNIDLEKINESDINDLLSITLSDLLLCSLWFQKNKKNLTIITNIDICK